MPKKTKMGITTKKENFSGWYSQILDKAEIVDLRLGIKGFIVIRPWGASIMENTYKLYEEELQKRGHKLTIMPSVIPESNLKKEASHIKGFTPEVFWLQSEKGEEKLALRPTSETLYTPMFALWIRSHRDLPLKLYQKGSVFRYDTKATRPLIRGREFQWIETHNAFATKREAEKHVQEDIQITEKIMHQELGIPFLPIKRPEWDKFAGAEYTIGSDVLMPDGRVIQQPSTHLMGQKFSKAFDAKFRNEKGEEEYLWTTAYGPAISRILVSIISTHGDDKGLILPFSISPIQIIIVPIYTKKNRKKIINESEKIKKKIESLKLRVEIDKTEKRPGEKYYEWELRGVPFRLEIGEKEIKNKRIILFTRDLEKKENLSIKNLSKLKGYGRKFDERLRTKAEKSMNGKIVNCKTKEQIKKAMREGKIARVNFCSIEKEGMKCAEHIEKEINAELRGVLANKKEKSTGNCIICGRKAEEVVYVAKSY